MCHLSQSDSLTHSTRLLGRRILTRSSQLSRRHLHRILSHNIATPSTRSTFPWVTQSQRTWRCTRNTDPLWQAVCPTRLRRHHHRPRTRARESCKEGNKSLDKLWRSSTGLTWLSGTLDQLFRHLAVMQWLTSPSKPSSVRAAPTTASWITPSTTFFLVKEGHVQGHRGEDSHS
jgi:hypothetical protein